MKTAPLKRLNSGATIPSIGLGTFGSDKYSAKEVADAVRDAASIGYRHFDCAAVYGNEREIGGALADVQRSGVSRSELFVTSKLWNDRHDDPEAACEESLRDLKLDYLDLYLIHWPVPNHHAPGVDVSARDPHAVPYEHERYMRTWRSMENLVSRGLARHIGTSNMTVTKLTSVMEDAEIRPHANQMELHPHFQQRRLLDFCLLNGVMPIGYCPLGSPSRPERDRTAEDSVALEDPVILKIAKQRGLSPAALCIKWAACNGHIPIPFSVKRAQYEESLMAVMDQDLTRDEMDMIASADRNCRLIKGQVFLWPSAKGWQDLWED
jgi:alcohol dehydrogenase (NADP+)